MGRKPCCEKVGLKKGPWTAEEDKKLVNFILTNGQCCWRAVPKLAGLLRCGKSCRLRWINYLRPDLKRGLLSESEEKLVIELHSRLGNRWSKIASHLPGRTDNEIKNHWNTHIKKKLRKMGIDPLTHMPLPPSEEAEDHHHHHHHHHEKHQEQHQDVVAAIEEPLLLMTRKQEEGEGSPDAADAFFSASPGFSTDEVPMIQPNEILVPCVSSTTSSSSTSPTPGSSSSSFFSSSGSTVRVAEMQLASVEWPLESMNMWGVDEFNGWDLMCDNGAETLGFGPLVQQYPSVASFDQEAWKFELF